MMINVLSRLCGGGELVREAGRRRHHEDRKGEGLTILTAV